MKKKAPEKGTLQGIFFMAHFAIANFIPFSISSNEIICLAV